MRPPGGPIPWLLVLAGALVFANGLGGPFVYDDASIVADRDIREWLPPWRAARASAGSAAAGRPVVHWSLALNHALGGLDPTGYHALNLAVHLACTLLLYEVVRRTLATPAAGGVLSRAAPGVAGAAALLWMVHPLQTECVDYVSQRSESIMALFYVGTLHASIRALEGKRRAAWTALAVGCSALGMASKESMVTAPVAVALWDAVFAGLPARRLLRERGALYGALAATWLVLGGLVALGPRAASVGFDLGTSAFDWFKNQCLVVVDYLRLALWPHPLALDYGYPRELPLATVAPYAALLALLVLAALWALWRRPAAGFAAVWPFLLLAPTSSFVPIVTEVGAERRMYLALAGPVALATAGATLLLARLSRDRAGRRRGTGIAATLAVALPLAGATFMRNRDYASAAALWRTAVEARPDNHRAHGNLAKALHEEGRLDEALAHYRHALEIRPDYPEGWSNMGSALWALGHRDEALEHWRRALVAWPAYADAHYNLARGLQAFGRLDEAVTHYREALRAMPGHARAHNNLGTALGSLGRLDEAAEHFREALRLAPDYEEARRNLELSLERARGPTPE